MTPQMNPRLQVAPAVVRESWVAYDALIARAFAQRDTPSASTTATPSLHSVDLQQLHAPEILTPDGETLGHVWDAVRELKSKTLAALPSKVQSLQGVEPSLSPLPPAKAISEVQPLVEQKKLKRKSRCATTLTLHVSYSPVDFSATLRESSDGRLASAS